MRTHIQQILTVALTVNINFILKNFLQKRKRRNAMINPDCALAARSDLSREGHFILFHLKTGICENFTCMRIPAEIKRSFDNCFLCSLRNQRSTCTVCFQKTDRINQD